MGGPEEWLPLVAACLSLSRGGCDAAGTETGLQTAQVYFRIDKIGSYMAISKELLDILVCPVCKAKVVLKEDGSGLKCVSCKRVYPVRDDIPVMLKDQATIEP